jgi:3-phenylpropionate/trans-cinnamate dioxygenase ferredoxin reductase component
MHVAIIGNGIAGVTAARAIRRRDPDSRVTVISGETDHHFSRPALMYLYMGHMSWRDCKPYQDHVWRSSGIDLVRAWVTAIDVERKQLVLDGEDVLGWDRLLIATGSRPNRFGWPGQDLGRVGGLVSLADLARLESASAGLRAAAVVGGGLIGVELAEMLGSRGVRTSLLVREQHYWNNVLPDEEAAMVDAVIRAHGIDLRLETELAEIVDDGTGQAGAIVDSHGARTEVGYVGLTAGVHPNVAVCAGSAVETGRGVLVDRQLRASAPDVWAAGDCAEIVTPEGQRNLIQAVWYTGRAQGEVAAAGICGEPVAYEQGVWFNSAKFFDLEYQVYGEVPGALAPQQLESLFWRHQDGRRSCRIVLRDGAVVGFNLVGVRFRHRVCERWIQEGRDPDYVLAHLRDACFDPELYRRWDKVIREGLGRQA